ncbi:MAG: hypothetical protein ACK56F_15125, partial [bacterium]
MIADLGTTDGFHGALRENVIRRTALRLSDNRTGGQDSPVGRAGLSNNPDWVLKDKPGDTAT